MEVVFPVVQIYHHFFVVVVLILNNLDKKTDSYHFCTYICPFKYSESLLGSSNKQLSVMEPVNPPCGQVIRRLTQHNSLA